MKKQFSALKNMIVTKRPALIISAAIILFICAGIINNLLFSHSQIDLTENNIYTLSESSKEVMSELTEPVHLRFFYSKQAINNIPTLQSYANRVSGLLKQYERLSKGRVSYEMIDPELFSKEEDQAVAFNIQAIPVTELGSKLYFGIAGTNSVDDIQTLPFLDPEREAFLEYDMTSLVYKLSNPKKPKIGVLSWIELEKQPYSVLQGQEDWSILDKIKETYDVELLDTETSYINDNIDTLFIIHPNNVTAETEYALDQYLLRGGKAIIFVDPYLEMSGAKSLSSNLPHLFDHWGVSYSEEEIILDAAHALRIPNKEPDARLPYRDKLNWLALTNDMMNPDEITSSKLNTVHIISGGYFSKKPLVDTNSDKTESSSEPDKTKKSDSKEDKHSTPALTIDPLFYSSNMSMLSSRKDLLDPDALAEHYAPTGKNYILAAHLSGMASSAFPNHKSKTHLDQSEEPIHAIIVADVDMLRDLFWVQKQRFFGQTVSLQVADNATFAINALDQLSGSSALIGLRSRTIPPRPFIVVEELRKQAEKNYLQQEQQLREQLVAGEKKLLEIQKAEMNDQNLLLDSTQMDEIEDFREQILQTRDQLRQVQHNLRKDIEKLNTFLKFLIIGILPMIVVLLGLFLPRLFGIKRR